MSESEHPGEAPTPEEPSSAPTPSKSAPVVRRKSGEKRGERRKKKGLPALLLFLLFGAAPAAVIGWFYTRPEADQEAILSRFPEGVGGRAMKAGICVAVLFGLARIALPAFHGTGAFLRNGLAWFRSRPTALRIVLLPIEFLTYLLFLIVQILFAVDAVLIVAACAATLILVARIVRPDLFESWLPEILK